MLKMENLHIALTEEPDSPIIRGVDLTVGAGEIHAIMGPNGSGKSTLCYTLAGRADYQITQGNISLAGEDLTEMDPEERAAAGLFLAYQYPVEIPGVSNMVFMREALNAQRNARKEAPLSAADFLRLVKQRAKKLNISQEMLKRPVNVGFSGGEKKRNEILQMSITEPKMCVLDETDSGLDIDAMQMVASGVNSMRSAERSFLVITHYQRLLNYIKPDIVHIIIDGRIIETGGPDLALYVEKHGYTKMTDSNAVTSAKAG